MDDAVHNVLRLAARVGAFEGAEPMVTEMHIAPDGSGDPALCTWSVSRA